MESAANELGQVAFSNDGGRSTGAPSVIEGPAPDGRHRVNGVCGAADWVLVFVRLGHRRLAFDIVDETSEVVSAYLFSRIEK